MLKYTNFLYLILIHFSSKEEERAMNAHWHCMLNMILKFKVKLRIIPVILPNKKNWRIFIFLFPIVQVNIYFFDSPKKNW